MNINFKLCLSNLLHCALLVGILTCLFNFSTKVSAKQNNTNYKLPFRAGEVWKAEVNGYGVHKDSKGFSFDFYAGNNSSKEILAPIDGVMGRGCTVNNSTYLSIKTEQEDVVRFFHVDAGSVLINEGEFVHVKQGDIIGKVTEAGTFETEKCKNSSDAAHLHFSWIESMCNFKIENYEFDCDDMKDCDTQGLYKVPCNGKNPSQIFVSTNKANYLDKDCKTNLSWNYSVGEYGIEVVKLQKCLAQIGLYNHSDGITGYFGNYTATQFREYSLNKKSKNYNFSDQNNLIKLDSQTNPATLVPTKCNQLLKQSYKVGDIGQNIIELQTCLTGLGLYNYPNGITGYFGNYTLGILNQYYKR
jgi:peptidoglycan hydrolase-like protein with peptidoglycan-binding domain